MSTNPYEFFAASDDEEDSKPNVVSGEQKKKRSTLASIQPTKKNASSKNNKKNKKKKHQKSPKPPEVNPFLNTQRSLTSIPTWRDPSASGNINSEKVTSTIDAQAPAESTLVVIQRTTSQGWRRIRKRRQCQGPSTTREVRQGRGAKT